MFWIICIIEFENPRDRPIVNNWDVMLNINHCNELESNIAFWIDENNIEHVINNSIILIKKKMLLKNNFDAFFIILISEK